MTVWLKPLTARQQEILLRPLNSTRVAQRTQSGRSLSYLEAWDVKAHLIRIFGFGGFSADVLSADVAFAEKNGNNWDVGYKVVLRLAIHQLGCTYTEAAVGTAHLPNLGEAHDMAIKTAESDALKRCAINLGTQFGLSLYDNGRLTDVVSVPGIPAPLSPWAVTPVRSDSDQPDDGVASTDDDMAAVNVVKETLGGTPVLSAEAVAWVDALRAYAPEEDAAKRIQGVAALKAQVDGAFLQQLTDVQGRTISLGRLADLVAGGAFVGAKA